MERNRGFFWMLLAGALLLAPGMAHAHIGASESRVLDGEEPLGRFTEELRAIPPAPHDAPPPRPEGALSVQSNVIGASVYVDGTYRGSTPLRIARLPPGPHSVRLSRPHYAARSVTVYVREDREHHVFLDLERITGMLVFSAAQEGTRIYCDGTLVHGTSLVVDEGYHVIRARCFGYADETANVYVLRRHSHAVSIDLKPAPFAITELSVSRRTINPEGRGALARTDISLSVTAAASGVLFIADKDGNTLWAQSYTFSTWSYGAEWDGRDRGGNPVPDGEYTVTLFAEGQSRSCTVTVDRSLAWPARTLGAGGTGVGAVPAAETFPSGTFLLQLGAGWQGAARGNETYGIPLSLGMAYQVGNHVELSATVDVDVLSCTDDRLKMGLALKCGAEARLGAQASLQYAAVLRAGFCGEPLFAPYGADTGAGLGAGLLLGLRAGSLYVGASSELVAFPVAGPTSTGDDVLWKNGIAVQHGTGALTFGAYAALCIARGDYEYRSEDGGEQHTGSIAGTPRALDAGFQASAFLGNSNALLSLTAGVLAYDSGTAYPYALVRLSFLF